MAAMSILHVNHITAALKNRFTDKIDLSDIPTQRTDRENFFLTRALAAFVIAELAKVDDAVAASSVVDGGSDNGIDAFFFDRSERVCYVVQSKFIKSGSGSMDLGDMLKFTEGLRDLLEPRLDKFAKLALKKQDISDVLSDSNATFRVVCAYTGQQPLAPEVSRPLEELVTTLNDGDEFVALNVLNQKRLHDIIATQALGEAVDLTVMLHEWGTLRDPYKSYYGQVAVADILKWAEFGDRLYHKNIRGFKGSTDVNEAIVTTVKGAPQNFWYFNNGITIVCSQLQKQPIGGDSRTSGVFECKSASVVNGAQTVGSIISVLKDDVNGAATARVLVRLISLDNCPPEFGSALTRAANTQNRIEKKDFASLDPQQARLRSDLLLSFGKDYVFRSGDRAPSADQGCTLDEATVALACAQADVGLCVQAKREVGRLYDSVENTPYTLLFNPSVSAQRLWHAVEVSRAVDGALREKVAQLDGKERLIAIHGNRLVLHVVFARLGGSALNDGTANLTEVLIKAKQATVKVLADVTAKTLTIYPSAYAANLFKNASKCKRLVDEIKNDVTTAGLPLLQGL
jgi:hypothetical protein